MNNIGLNCENPLDMDFFQLTTVQFTPAVQINVVLIGLFQGQLQCWEPMYTKS